MLAHITVEAREVYGQMTCYPACPGARLFADIAGTRTLTGAALRRIEAAGIEVRIVRPSVTLAGR